MRGLPVGAGTARAHQTSTTPQEERSSEEYSRARVSAQRRSRSRIVVSSTCLLTLLVGVICLVVVAPVLLTVFLIMLNGGHDFGPGATLRRGADRALPAPRRDGSATLRRTALRAATAG